MGIALPNTIFLATCNFLTCSLYSVLNNYEVIANYSLILSFFDWSTVSLISIDYVNKNFFAPGSLRASNLTFS